MTTEKKPRKPVPRWAIWSNVIIWPILIGGCAAAVATQGSSDSPLQVDATNSACVAMPSAATLEFRVTLTNPTSSAHSTRIVPWRRYDDASVNDGVLDRSESFSLAAGQQQVERLDVPWDETKHVPVECRVYLGDSTTYASIGVGY